MSKDKGRIVVEVFTITGKKYKVKCNVILSDLKQAIALRNIISSFETSATKREGSGVKSITRPTAV